MTFAASADTEEEAARMYDRVASIVYGEFAKTNKDLGLLE
jgi:hypothetical protein